jgi:hypothetical protein
MQIQIVGVAASVPVRRRRSRQVHIFLSDQQYLWVVDLPPLIRYA